MRTLLFMGVCAFVASGLNFDVDRYLKGSPFKAISVFRKGQIPAKDNPERQPRPDSGFVVVVSEDQGADASQKYKEALTFLFQHEKELDRLKDVGVDNMLLDFGVAVGDKLQQSEYMPPEFIVALGRFGMGLVFTTIQLPRG